MNRESHDLFLLMINLSQIRNRDTILRVFVDAVNSFDPSAKVLIIEADRPVEQESVEIATAHYSFGKLVIDWIGEKDDHLLSLLSNAAQMLALILENREQQKLLSQKNLRLEQAVRKRTAELREAELRFRLLAENARDMLFRFLLSDNRYEYVSPAACRITGYTPEAFYADGELLDRITADENTSYRREQRDRIVAGESIPFYEYKIRHKKGGIRWLNQRDVLIRDDDGRAVAIEGICTDVTRQKEAEAELIGQKSRAEESESRFRSLVETTSDWIWEIDAEGIFTYVSPRVIHLLGYEPWELAEKNVFDLMPLNEGSRVRTIFSTAVENKKPIHGLINVNRHKDGHEVVIESNANPIIDIQGRLKGYRGIDRDITDRKRFEQSLQVSIHQKEVLLQELYHRTKNNMQVISALLELQAATSGSEQIMRIVDESKTRIRTMALAHEKLYKSQNLSSIDIKGYIQDLVELLILSYAVSRRRIAVITEIESFNVLIDIAIPCGLIITELLSNAFKHAFPDNRSGSIGVEIHREEHQIHMLIRDDGVGLVPEFDIIKKGSLGVSLVYQIVRHELHGSIEFDATSGLCWQIIFRDDIYKERV